MYSKGGCAMQQSISAGDGTATIALGPVASHPTATVLGKSAT